MTARGECGTPGYSRRGCKCDPCHGVRAERDRRYREANREKLAERSRRYREANREQVAERDRRYREANREKLAERSRRYWEANREQVAESKHRYREANREQVAESKRRYYEAASSQIIARQVAKNAATREIATRHRQPWTEAEDRVLTTNPHMSAIELACILRRTKHSVNKRRHDLRLTAAAA